MILQAALLSFFYQPSSVRGWTSAFILALHRLCGVIEGRLSHFLSRWLKTGWQSVISQKKSLEILRHGWELNMGHREDRQWAIPLSYHHPGHREDRQWAIPLSYHHPGHREDRQWAIPLSYHDWTSLSYEVKLYSSFCNFCSREHVTLVLYNRWLYS